MHNAPSPTRPRFFSPFPHATASFCSFSPFPSLIVFLMFGPWGGILHKSVVSSRERTIPVPTFSNKLPALSKHQGFDLRRTPQSKTLHAICTCEELLVCDTHYWHGRTLPCERVTNDEGKTVDDSNCSACLSKQPWRTHAYVSAFDPRTHDHFIFECTAFAAKTLQDYYTSVGTLRGCILIANRPKCGPNSKVQIVTATANLQRQPIPSAPDIARALSVIWRLPRTAIDLLPDVPSTNRISTLKKPLADMRNQRDNDADPPTIANVLSGNGQSPKKR